MTRKVAIVALALLAGCQDSMPSLEPVSGPSFHISEARFGGGNADLFFAAPLATTPQPGDDKFDVGGANSLLVPHVRICETEGEPTPLGCRNDVTLQITGFATGLPMSFIAATELYQVELETHAFAPGKSYRIEIWGLAFSTAAEKASLDPRWLFGWRDVVNAPSTSNCTGTEAFCPIRYGQNIPVRVRIEQSVFCPTTRNCAVQFVSAGANANLEAQLNPTTGAPSAQLFIPAQAGTNFSVAFEPCTAAEDAAVSNAIDLPTFGPCLKTTSLFTGTLGTPAIVSLCDNLDPTGFGLSHSQQHQLALHHFRADLSKVTALPEVWQCLPPTSGQVASASRPGVLRLATVLGQKVRALLTPRPLYASAAMIDRGGGGQTSEFGSFFKLALPGKFEYVSPEGGELAGVAGAPLALQVKVTDLLGDAVRNARVRWRAIVPPNDGATVLGSVPSTPTLTDAQGVAQTTAQLASNAGRNVFYAFGRGIADNRATGCTISPNTPAACNGPRVVYDPFLPLHVPEFDPTGPELPIDIAENTRIRFGVNACAAGRGTAVVDGNFSSSEWACATAYSLSVESPTGLTPATLYVMNDGARLYLALRIQRRPTDKVLSLQFNFDNNNSWKTSGSGAAETGDDVLVLESGKGFTDAYLTLACTTSTQVSCWKNDVNDGGTKDGSGALKNDGTFTTYELAHPLNTADNAHDFSLSLGNNFGLFLTLSANGNSGTTIWPAFRQYQEIRITP